MRTARSITVDRMAGEDYAIVPIMVQVEYPANGSTTEIILPDSVTLLDYEGNAADGEETENILRASYTDTSAAAHGIYVQAAQDFTAEFVYTAPDGTELSKSLEVKVSDGGTNPIVTAKSGISTYAAEPTPRSRPARSPPSRLRAAPGSFGSMESKHTAARTGSAVSPMAAPHIRSPMCPSSNPASIPGQATMPTRSTSGADLTSCRSVCLKKSTAVLPLRPMAWRTMQQREPPTAIR